MGVKRAETRRPARGVRQSSVGEPCGSWSPGDGGVKSDGLLHAA